MPNFNSIADAIHDHMDKMLLNGIATDPSFKVQNAADSLNNMTRVYLSKLDRDTAQAIMKDNEHLDRDLADQLSFAFDVLGAFAGSYDPNHSGDDDEIIYEGGTAQNLNDGDDIVIYDGGTAANLPN